MNQFKDTLYLLVFMSTGAIIAMLFTYAITPVLFDVNFSDLRSVITQGTLNNNVDFLKLMQLTQSIGLFIAPVYLYCYYKTKTPVHSLDLNQGFSFKAIPAIIALVLFSNPFIGWLSFWNSHIVFPEFLSGLENWMLEKEAMAAETTKLFLQADGVNDFLLNLFLIAVIPAIGEEFLFRGILQKKLVSKLRNPHVAIFISATVFSAIHLQFYGFFPRLILGLGLGYLYYFSRSLWTSIFAHFINNGMAVAFVYFTSDLSLVIPDPKEDLDIAWYAIIGSLVACIGLMKMIQYYVETPKEQS